VHAFIYALEYLKKKIFSDFRRSNKLNYRKFPNLFEEAENTSLLAYS